MRFKAIVLLGLISCLCSVTTWAQTEPEYRLELGGGLGLAAYEGDFNNSLLKSMKPMATLVAKYKMNPRMAWALLVGYTQLKGSSAKADTWYPELQQNPISFKSNVVDVSLRYEYNFLPFGTGREYHGAQRLTPFLTIGTGLTVANAGTTVAGLQMPVGFGMKYKVGNRWNLAVAWTMHFTSTDRIDGVSDPYGIKSSGLFKNTDCYSVLGATLTYDLWAKCRTCHNDND